MNRPIIANYNISGYNHPIELGAYVFDMWKYCDELEDNITYLESQITELKSEITVLKNSKI